MNLCVTLAVIVANYESFKPPFLAFFPAVEGKRVFFCTDGS